MAADVWKIKDMYGRVFLYENEKSFVRRLKSSIGDYEERIEWNSSHNNHAWVPQQVESFRIENDSWVPQQLDSTVLKAYLDKRLERRLKREARSRGYKI